MPTNLLTHSSLAVLRQCPRRYRNRYEYGIAPRSAATPLRLGGAYHVGHETRNGGRPDAEAIGAAIGPYENCPEGFDRYEWEIERETVHQLLAGYFWRYQGDDFQIIHQEQAYTDVRVTNPDTNAGSRTFQSGGKIDAIIRLADGRLALLEYKTCGEDISPDSDYWLRLRADPQVSKYWLDALSLGFEIEVAIYDVARKPTIQPRQIPILDDNGDKIVLDRDGVRVLTKQGKPRQTSSTEDGFVLQTRRETPEEYGQRLLADIGERPDYYYQRREVSRTADDLAEWQEEQWQQSQALLEMRRNGRWFRNVTRWNCSNCEFQGPCLSGVQIDPEHVPSGYVVLDDLHPELKGNDE